MENLTTLYETGAKKAVKTIAQLKVDYRYEVSIESSSYNSSSHTWTGKFKVENPSDGTVAISVNDVTVTFIEDEQSSMQSKMKRQLKQAQLFQQFLRLSLQVVATSLVVLADFTHLNTQQTAV